MFRRVSIFLLKAGVALILILTVTTASLFAYVHFGGFGKLPDPDEILSIQNSSATRVVDINGEELARFYLQDRTPILFDQISPHIIDALIATEDKRFYDHSGVDYRSLVRVAVKSILLGDQSAGGGSTITQQLVKSVWPRKDAAVLYYPLNKSREILIARRIEEVYTKEEILTLYLNTVSFGLDVFGVETAARRYFGTNARNVSIGEAALLVGMLKATTYYNPLLHPERANNRKNLVLELMVQSGFISAEESERFQNVQVEIEHETQSLDLRGYVLHQIKLEAKELLVSLGKDGVGNYHLETDGLVIRTSIDESLQGYAEDAVLKHMKWLQKEFDREWSEDRWKELSTVLDREMRSTKSVDSTLNRELFSWDGLVVEEVTVLDSIKYHLKMLQAGFVSLNPKSGAIRSWVGGIDYTIFPYDHVSIHSKRQVGSTFKPLVYAAALENGLSPCTYYKAELAAYEDTEGEWVPENSNGEYDGKYSMEGALEGSVNTVSVKIMKEVGVENAISTAHNLGVTTELPEVPSLVLGTASISLLEMVTAYAVLSNGGRSVSPYLIESISTSEGQVLYERNHSKGKQVISPETSAVMTHLLLNVVNDGTGRALRTTYRLSNDIGGKTGTTQAGADGWFISVTPELATGAWVGGKYPAVRFNSSKGQGAVMALPMIGHYFQQINADREQMNVSRAKFTPLRADLQSKLDCDPFKDNFNLFEWLFGKKKQKQITKKTSKKENVFKKIGNLFKKKKKD